jgi:octanoyl-[GcvH]:protein N-octanoyltransferase
MTTQLQLPNAITLLDRTKDTKSEDILYPFALEELLCRKIGQGASPMLHLWRHPGAFVMGLRDSRLPQVHEARKWLESQGYTTAVRNSGGAAVPLDLNVLNMTLMLPRITGNMDYRKDFETMTELIRESLAELTGDVMNGEVAGSFCPGDYDMSIQGRKFCGIAQRRQQFALAVQAFVIVDGAGEDKAAMARAFYDRAAVGAETSEYPTVLPGSMASLSECIGIKLTSEQFAAAVIELLRNRGWLEATNEVNLPEEDEVQAMIELMRQRYGIVR